VSSPGPGPRRGALRALVAGLLMVLGRRRRDPSSGSGERSGPPQGPAATHDRSAVPSRGAENAVLLALAGATLAAIAFVVLFIVLPDTQLLGLTFGGALALLAVAAIVAGKRVVPQEIAIEEREDLADEQAQREVAEIVRDAGDGVSRRRLLVGAAGATGATVGAAALVPAAALGPKVGETIEQTPWSRGRRVVDSDDKPVKPEDVAVGSFLTAFPEGASRRELGASVVLVKIPPGELEIPARLRAVAPEGVLAFSKICPHAGCAIGIYRHPLHEPTSRRPALICPCHYSTFDVRRGGTLEFGPAGRDLPQLPLMLGPGRELLAAGDFLEAIGPSWRGIRRNNRP
jgi:ubiquinol-cytochrome c reductase iron-sulfur subunit